MCARGYPPKWILLDAGGSKCCYRHPRDGGDVHLCCLDGRLDISAPNLKLELYLPLYNLIYIENSADR